MIDDDFAVLDAIALAELVRRREVHPVELLETAIARIERLNPRLNAVVTRFLLWCVWSQANPGPYPAGAGCG